MFTAFNNIIPILQVRTLRISEIKSLSQGRLARNQHTEDLNPEFILFTLPLKMDAAPGWLQTDFSAFPARQLRSVGFAAGPQYGECSFTHLPKLCLPCCESAQPRDVAGQPVGGPRGKARSVRRGGVFLLLLIGDPRGNWSRQGEKWRKRRKERQNRGGVSPTSKPPGQ